MAAIIGAATEAVAMELMKRRLGQVAQPYSSGAAGSLQKATIATAGGGALVMAAAERVGHTFTSMPEWCRGLQLIDSSAK